MENSHGRLSVATVFVVDSPLRFEKLDSEIPPRGKGCVFLSPVWYTWYVAVGDDDDDEEPFGHHHQYVRWRF